MMLVFTQYHCVDSRNYCVDSRNYCVDSRNTPKENNKVVYCLNDNEVRLSHIMCLIVLFNMWVSNILLAQ